VTFNLDDYIEVSERVAQFYAKYPDGRLSTELVQASPDRVIVKAFAYRSADDRVPSTGLSGLEIPGSTPYTRGSELENAETSAVGRAIAFCGFPTKKIASKEEVAARQQSDVVRTSEASEGPATRAAPTNPAVAAHAVYQEKVVPGDGADPALVECHFGKNKGRALGDLTAKQLAWYADVWDPDSNPDFPSKPTDRRLKMAAQILVHGAPSATIDIDESVPF